MLLRVCAAAAVAASLGGRTFGAGGAMVGGMALLSCYPDATTHLLLRSANPPQSRSGSCCSERPKLASGHLCLVISVALYGDLESTGSIAWDVVVDAQVQVPLVWCLIQSGVTANREIPRVEFAQQLIRMGAW